MKDKVIKFKSKVVDKGNGLKDSAVDKSKKAWASVTSTFSLAVMLVIGCLFLGNTIGVFSSAVQHEATLFEKWGWTQGPSVMEPLVGIILLMVFVGIIFRRLFYNMKSTPKKKKKAPAKARKKAAPKKTAPKTQPQTQE